MIPRHSIRVPLRLRLSIFAAALTASSVFAQGPASPDTAKATGTTEGKKKQKSSSSTGGGAVAAGLAALAAVAAANKKKADSTAAGEKASQEKGGWAIPKLKGGQSLQGVFSC